MMSVEAMLRAIKSRLDKERRVKARLKAELVAARRGHREASKRYRIVAGKWREDQKLIRKAARDFKRKQMPLPLGGEK